MTEGGKAFFISILYFLAFLCKLLESEGVFLYVYIFPLPVLFFSWGRERKGKQRQRKQANKREKTRAKARSSSPLMRPASSKIVLEIHPSRNDSPRDD